MRIQQDGIRTGLGVKKISESQPNHLIAVWPLVSYTYSLNLKYSTGQTDPCGQEYGAGLLANLDGILMSHTNRVALSKFVSFLSLNFLLV